MSAIGPERTCVAALHESAFDPKQTPGLADKERMVLLGVGEAMCKKT
jgi:hypothetical protein